MASEIVQKETKLANGWMAWSVEGRIDISTADSVYQSGEAIVEREEKTVLDMSGVAYISSAGLRVLLRLLKKAKKEGKEFTVAGFCLPCWRCHSWRRGLLGAQVSLF